MTKRQSIRRLPQTCMERTGTKPPLSRPKRQVQTPGLGASRLAAEPPGNSNYTHLGSNDGPKESTESRALGVFGVVACVSDMHLATIRSTRTCRIQNSHIVSCKRMISGMCLMRGGSSGRPAPGLPTKMKIRGRITDEWSDSRRLRLTPGSREAVYRSLSLSFTLPEC